MDKCDNMGSGASLKKINIGSTERIVKGLHKRSLSDNIFLESQQTWFSISLSTDFLFKSSVTWLNLDIKAYTKPLLFRKFDNFPLSVISVVS